MQQSRLKPPELVCSLSSSSSAALRENLPLDRRRRRDQAEREAVALQGIRRFFSRCSAWAGRHGLVPVDQMGQLRRYFYVREAAADVDSH